MAAHARGSHERGSALLVALGLLALGAALLAGSARSGRSASIAARSQASSITADAEARFALAEFVAGWAATDDSLTVGQPRESTIGPRRVGAAGLFASTRLRLLRVTANRFVLGLETTVGPPGIVGARRRICVIMARDVATDTSSLPASPRPIARWSTADLF